MSYFDLFRGAIEEGRLIVLSAGPYQVFQTISGVIRFRCRVLRLDRYIQQKIEEDFPPPTPTTNPQNSH